MPVHVIMRISFVLRKITLAKLISYFYSQPMESDDNSLRK